MDTGRQGGCRSQGCGKSCQELTLACDSVFLSRAGACVRGWRPSEVPAGCLAKQGMPGSSALEQLSSCLHGKALAVERALCKHRECSYLLKSGLGLLCSSSSLPCKLNFQTSGNLSLMRFLFVSLCFEIL